MTQNKNFLIIGGSGFVGSHLIPTALSCGHSVAVLNRGHRPYNADNVLQLIADRSDESQMAQAGAIAGNFDVVVDTSSYNMQSSKIAWSIFSGKTAHWIHLSSAAVYQETPGRYPSEEDPIGGAAVWGDYGVEKAAAESYLIDQSERLPVTILRPPYLYGPGNDNDRETFVWSRCLRKRPVIVPSDGRTEIQFLHARELAEVIIRAAFRPAKSVEVFNVAASERVSLSRWVEIAANIAEFESPGLLAGKAAEGFAPRQYFPFRDYPCCVEVGLIKAQLGWESEIKLSDGLKETFLSYSREYLTTCSKIASAEDEIFGRIVDEGKLGRS